MKKRCIVCGGEVCPEELNELAPEYKDTPVHGDCFDSFENADDFIQYAITKTDDPTTIKALKDCLCEPLFDD